MHGIVVVQLRGLCQIEMVLISQDKVYRKIDNMQNIADQDHLNMQYLIK